MGNTSSSPINEKEDWEGKFFTTSDGVKLSANVIKRLSSDKEEENIKPQENNEEIRKQMDDKLGEMEQTHIEQQMELERQRDRNHKMMSEYDTMIGSREIQVHQLISQLENERIKYVEAVQTRDEKLTEICNSWNEKLGNKENEYKQMEDRLKGRETELINVSNSLNEQIQAEKDKLSGYQDVFNERLLLMQDKFKFAVDGIVQGLKQHQDQVNHKYEGLTEDVAGEKIKFENVLEQFAARVSQHEDKLNGITGNFEDKINIKVEKFQGVLEGFNQTVDQQNEKLMQVAAAEDDLLAKVKNEQEKFSTITSQLTEQIANEELKLCEVTTDLTKQIKQEQEKVMPSLITSPLYEEPEYFQEPPVSDVQHNQIFDATDHEEVEIHNVVDDNCSKISDFHHQYDDSQSKRRNENLDRGRYKFVCEPDPQDPCSLEFKLIDKGPEAYADGSLCNPPPPSLNAGDQDVVDNIKDGMPESTETADQHDGDENTCLYDDSNRGKYVVVCEPDPQDPCSLECKIIYADADPDVGADADADDFVDELSTIQPVAHTRYNIRIAEDDCDMECESADDDDTNLQPIIPFSDPSHSHNDHHVQDDHHAPYRQNQYYDHAHPTPQYLDHYHVDTQLPHTPRDLKSPSHKSRRQESAAAMNKPDFRSTRRVPTEAPTDDCDEDCRADEEVQLPSYSPRSESRRKFSPSLHSNKPGRPAYIPQEPGIRSTRRVPKTAPTEDTDDIDEECCTADEGVQLPSYSPASESNRDFSPRLHSNKPGRPAYTPGENQRTRRVPKTAPTEDTDDIDEECCTADEGVQLPSYSPASESHRDFSPRLHSNKPGRPAYTPGENQRTRRVPKTAPTEDTDDIDEECTADEEVQLPSYSPASESHRDFSPRLHSNKPGRPAYTPGENQRTRRVPKTAPTEDTDDIDEEGTADDGSCIFSSYAPARESHRDFSPRLHSNKHGRPAYTPREQPAPRVYARPQQPYVYSKRGIPKEESYLPRGNDIPVRKLPDCDDNCTSDEDDELPFSVEEIPKPKFTNNPNLEHNRKTFEDMRTHSPSPLGPCPQPYPQHKEKQQPIHNRKCKKPMDGRVKTKEHVRDQKIYVVPNNPNFEHNRKTFEDMLKPYSHKYPVDDRMASPSYRRSDNRPAGLPTRPKPRNCQPTENPPKRPEFLYPQIKSGKGQRGLNEEEILNDFSAKSYPRRTPEVRVGQWWVSDGQQQIGYADEEDYISFRNATPNGYSDENIGDWYDFNNDNQMSADADSAEFDPCDLEGIVNTHYDDKLTSADDALPIDPFTEDVCVDAKQPAVNTDHAVPVEVVQVVDLVEAVSAVQVECAIRLEGKESLLEVRNALEVEEIGDEMEGTCDDGEEEIEPPYLAELEDVVDSNPCEDESGNFGGSFQTRKLDNISKVVYDEFESAADSVENKFKSPGFQSVCNIIQTHLLDCYKLNPGKPLSCNEELESLRKCVSSSKNSLWKKD